LVTLVAANATSQGWINPLATALKMEIELSKENPDRYYLVIDTKMGQVHLKAGGRPLLTSGIKAYFLEPELKGTRQVVYRSTVSPGSPVPASSGQRLAGRRLPLNFVGRLIEGPTTRDRILFSEDLVIAPDPSRIPPDFSYVVLPPKDIKSLSAALEDSTTAILVHLDESPAER